MDHAERQVVILLLVFCFYLHHEITVIKKSPLSINEIILEELILHWKHSLCIYSLPCTTSTKPDPLSRFSHKLYIITLFPFSKNFSFNSILFVDSNIDPSWILDLLSSEVRMQPTFEECTISCKEKKTNICH